MLSNEKIEEMLDLLLELDSAKIYLGCDSKVFSKAKRDHNGKVIYTKKGNPVKETFARYASVVIIHKNGNNGCRIFSDVSVERNFDKRKNKPKMRMMTEVQKVCDLYLQIYEFIKDFDIEIHLDISTDPKNGSNCAAKEAAGYIQGMTGAEPKLKPDSWAASHASDHIVNSKQKNLDRKLRKDLKAKKVRQKS